MRAEGHAEARVMGGDHRSRLPAHRAAVVELVAAQPDLTLQEIRGTLAGRGLSVGLVELVAVSAGAEHITLKKRASTPSEQHRPEVAEKRRAFTKGRGVNPRAKT